MARRTQRFETGETHFFTRGRPKRERVEAKKPDEILNSTDTVGHVAKYVGVDRGLAARYINGQVEGVPPLKLFCVRPTLYNKNAIDAWLRAHEKELAGLPAMQR